jgi:hypothetical protein
MLERIRSVPWNSPLDFRALRAARVLKEITA